MERKSMKIKSAAFQCVYTGKSHLEIYSQLCRSEWTKPILTKEGFITDTGVFVDRVEAMKIAKIAGQVTNPIYDVELHSCDLKDNI